MYWSVEKGEARYGPLNQQKRPQSVDEWREALLCGQTTPEPRNEQGSAAAPAAQREQTSDSVDRFSLFVALAIAGLVTIGYFSQPPTPNSTSPLKIINRVLGLTPVADEDRLRQVHQASSSDVCRKALNGAQSDWDQNTSYLDYVKEAGARGMTIDTCRTTLGLAQVPSEERPQQINMATSLDVCRNALDAADTRWNQNASFDDYVKAAKARGMTIDSLPSAVGVAFGCKRRPRFSSSEGIHGFFEAAPGAKDLSSYHNDSIGRQLLRPHNRHFVQKALS